MRLYLIFILILLIQPTGAQNTLDLKEANVTNVEYSLTSGTSYNFAVTLYHDDDGESPNYADKWIVEDQTGNLLGERILLHSHGTVEFTRSGEISIPDELDIVIIRGHDQNHNYGGQVIVLKISTNERLFIDQGSDRADFANTQFTFSDSSNDTSIIDENTISNSTTLDLNKNNSSNDATFPHSFFISITIISIIASYKKRFY